MASRRRILQKLDELEPGIARAFREAAEKIRSKARIAELEAAIEAMDVERAMAAAGITAASWSRLTEQIRSAYREGGEFAAADAPARLGFDFDMNNRRAEEWLRDSSSTLVTRIQEEQREAIRVVMSEGVRRGDNPRRIALDIAGRMNRRTKRRTGGIVGLTSPQSKAVESARNELLSGDSEAMRQYLGKKRRDKRFDSIVMRAMDEGKPVSRRDVDKITARYSDRLLSLRGETIARTEALTALNEASDESLRQAVDEGLVNEENIVRIWDATADMNTRPWHMEADGQRRGLNEPFNVGGAQMMHPGDPAGGARNVINCRCVIREEIDWVAQEQAV